MKKKKLFAIILGTIIILLIVIFFKYSNDIQSTINVVEPNYNNVQIKDFRIVKTSEYDVANSYKALGDNCIIIFDSEVPSIVPKAKIYPYNINSDIIKKLALLKYENTNVFFYILKNKQMNNELEIANLLKKSASIYDEIINRSNSYVINKQDFTYNFIDSFILLTKLQDYYVFRAYIIYGKKDNGTTKFYYLRKDFALISSNGHSIKDELEKYKSKFIKNKNYYQVDLISPYPNSNLKISKLKYELPGNKSWELQLYNNYNILGTLDIEKDSILWNVSNKKGLLIKGFFPLKEFNWSQIVNIESNLKNKVTKIKEYEELILKKNFKNKNSLINHDYDIQIED